MSTIAEIEAAFLALPREQQYELYGKLGRQLPPVAGPEAPHPPRHGFLDIPSVHLGAVLKTLASDDDLLGEMLEGQT